MSAPGQGIPGLGSCMFPDCQAVIPAGHLMCVRHWYSTPEAARTLVAVMLRRWKRNECALSALREAQTAAVDAAADAARLRRGGLM